MDFLTILFLIAGFVLLLKGADFLVNGSASIAKRLNWSDAIIGLTVVAFGTSAPELVVNILASFQGSGQIAVGNIIGSNIANILLIIGVAAFLRPLRIKSSTIWKELYFCLLAVTMVLIVGNDILFDGTQVDLISRTDGIVLLGFFAIFMYHTYEETRKGREDENDIKVYSSFISLLMVIAGMIGLGVGGQLLVSSASTIAAALGLSETIIGLTVVAIGTSLPELATTVVAARAGRMDIAVGNVIGSNIFNVFWILGLSSVIRQIPYDPVVNNFDTIISILATALFGYIILSKRGRPIGRYIGVLFLSLYFAYLVFSLFIRV